MNIATSTMTTESAWDLPPDLPPIGGTGRSEADIEEFQTLRLKVKENAERMGLNKAQTAKRIGMAEGTFSQWYSAKYAGRYDNQNAAVRRWVDQQESQSGLFELPKSPSFFQTKTAQEVFNTLGQAQALGDLTLISLGAGMGKTTSCRQYQAMRSNVFMATVSPHTKTVHAMLTELVSELGIHVHNPAAFTRAIGQRLAQSKNSLLIIDEAQNLVPDAVNQLRHFSDLYECGVALVGNEDIETAFREGVKAKGKTDGQAVYQLKRRVGKRLKRLVPYPEDIAAAIAAWGVTDEKSIKLLTGIGRKGGALGQIDKTMRAAHLQAIAMRSEVSHDLIQAAWKSRDVGEFS